ncbi:MAG TPA: rod shape-determining protein MreD [Candidatus Limivivens intestinipullorum]|uniref:Rod shape-determining protein MreD n=1 Tax=Candidatus Limivivens intestinipullorum TaxID=2840858 RepID=A0A9D1ETA2_9FIRM|nr:rod shape-determining protein MreD [Candidatus Limivivens intestinipullorum]
MKRRIVMILLIFFGFILQSTLLKQIAIANISPNLLLILTVSFGLMRGKKEGMFTGFLCGFLSDLMYGDILGFQALLYLTAGYLCGFCYRIFYDDDIKMPVVLIAGSDLAYGILMYAFQFLLRGRISFPYYLGRIIIPEVLYTMILTILIYRLLLRLNRLLEKGERRSVDSFV